MPSALVLLDARLRTPHGKQDRKALPAPEKNSPEPAGSHVIIWCDVLKRRNVSVNDDFFDLGGHSLLAMQVMTRVRDAFEVDLPLRSLFERPTVAALAEALKNAAPPQLERRAELLLRVAEFSESEVDAMLMAGRNSLVEVKSP